MQFSVLMTVWAKDNPKFLELSLQSLVDQTLQPDELILIGDGPITDELHQVIESFMKHVNWIHYVELNENVGLGAALNEGLSRCRYSLVARMDCDDIALPERFKLQIDEFKSNPQIDILGGYAEEFITDPQRITSIKTVPLTHEKIYEYGKRRNPFIHPAVMYKKDVIKALGGYRTLRRGQDIDLFARLLYAGYHGQNLPIPLIKFRASPDVYKRRKSWKASKIYISTIYRMWKMGYSSIIDLIVASFGRLSMMVIPAIFLKWIYIFVLRKQKL